MGDGGRGRGDGGWGTGDGSMKPRWRQSPPRNRRRADSGSPPRNWPKPKNLPVMLISRWRRRRAIFKDDKARLTALGLTGAAPRATAGFLASAVSLFDNAAGAPTLAEYGYDAERLESERAKIAAFNLSNQRQEAAKGAAQQASREQDMALTSLEAWRAQYIKIARVALRSKSQLLEKIGVPARTSQTAAQRAARKKEITV